MFPFCYIWAVVQQAHTLQAIWGFGLMEKLVCIWKIWQIRKITLI